MRGVGLNLDDIGQVLRVGSNGSIVLETCCSPGESC